MAYVVDICFEKVDIKDKIQRLSLGDKNLQSIIAYNNFYNTLLSDPGSEECDSMETFILYHPHEPGSPLAFINMNIFANNLLKMGKTVFFLKFLRNPKRPLDPDMPQFSIPIQCEDLTELTCDDSRGLKTRIIDFGDDEVDIHLASRFPDVIIPPTWFCTEDENLRIGGGSNNWFKFVRKVEILWKRKPKVVAAVYDFQFKPKQLLSELCKCRKRAEFLKMDFAFPGDDLMFKPQPVCMYESDSSDDGHVHHKPYTRPGNQMTTDHLEYDKSVWDGVWAPNNLKNNPRE